MYTHTYNCRNCRKTLDVASAMAVPEAILHCPNCRQAGVLRLVRSVESTTSAPQPASDCADFVAVMIATPLVAESVPEPIRTPYASGGGGDYGGGGASGSWSSSSDSSSDSSSSSGGDGGSSD